MTTSENGRNLVESFEGFSPTAYKDQRGIWTLGYGHTHGVVEGMVCTPVQADAYLEADLGVAEKAAGLVKAPLNQNQFDALVSLCFNIGPGNFATSTVARRLNLDPPDYANAASAILMWDKTAGEVNPGLVRRRNAELALFLTPVM